MEAKRANGMKRSGKRCRGCDGVGVKREMRRLGRRKARAEEGPPKRT